MLTPPTAACRRARGQDPPLPGAQGGTRWLAFAGKGGGEGEGGREGVGGNDGGKGAGRQQ